jgi:hypothetical protein
MPLEGKVFLGSVYLKIGFTKIKYNNPANKNLNIKFLNSSSSYSLPFEKRQPRVLEYYLFSQGRVDLTIDYIVEAYPKSYIIFSLESKSSELYISTFERI